MHLHLSHHRPVMWYVIDHPFVFVLSHLEWNNIAPRTDKEIEIGRHCEAEIVICICCPGDICLALSNTRVHTST